jgi:hypothetical protein
VVSLDIEKAFDTILLTALLYKMIRLGFPNSLIKLLKSYMTNRIFRVVVNGYESLQHVISNGLPEGSIISPTLFKLFVHDIPDTTFTKLQMFADDTSIISSAHHVSVAYARMQRHLNILQEYFTKSKISINASKTLFLVMNRRRKKPIELPKVAII